MDEINIESRLQMLRILRNLQVYAHMSTPSSISYAIQIFGMAISQDDNSEIIKEASLGLAELRHIIYPTAPTLAVLNNPSEFSQTLSVQSYQSDKMTVSRQIIEVNDHHHDLDEPSKRPRLEEKTLNSENSMTNRNAESNKDEIIEDEMMISFCNVPSS